MAVFLLLIKVNRKVLLKALWLALLKTLSRLLIPHTSSNANHSAVLATKLFTQLKQSLGRPESSTSMVKSLLMKKFFFRRSAVPVRSQPATLKSRLLAPPLTMTTLDYHLQAVTALMFVFPTTLVMVQILLPLLFHRCEFNKQASLVNWKASIELLKAMSNSMTIQLINLPIIFLDRTVFFLFQTFKAFFHLSNSIMATLFFLM